MRLPVAIVLAVCGTCAAELQSAKVRLNGIAHDVVQQLYSYYDWKTGFFGNYSAGMPFWTTANAIETLSNYMMLTGDLSPLPMLENSYIQMQPRYCGRPEGSCWFDDHLWFVLAWARLFSATGNTTYLTQSETIYGDMITKWGAWNETCGGIQWEKGNAYVNAIPNELFLSASLRLATLTGSSTPVGNFSYSDWATTDWEWFTASAMPISQPGGGLLITDGLSTVNCSLISPGGAYWTYNQGVILSGLSQLVTAGYPALAATARNIADTAIAYYSANDANVLFERNCGNNGQCGGQDGKMFKGVFVRHLAYAAPVISGGDESVLARYAGWLLNQTDSILAVGSLMTANGLAIGQQWQGPFTWDSTPWVSTNSGLDAVLAVLSIMP